MFDQRSAASRMSPHNFYVKEEGTEQPGKDIDRSGNALQQCDATGARCLSVHALHTSVFGCTRPTVETLISTGSSISV